MLALRIALRYLLAPKSHRAVNVISIISVAGVAVATLAIVVVLSVFNGFTDLASSQLARIDPDVRLLPVRGKVIAGADSLCGRLEHLPAVEAAMPVLEERALMVAGDVQLPVRFRGVDYARVGRVMAMDSIVIDGYYGPYNGLPDSVAAAQISVGVALRSGLRPSPYQAASIFVPRRTGRINPANPAAAYRRLPVAVTGVTQVEQQDYDNDLMFVSLDQARDLLEYSSGEASSVDVRLRRGASFSEAVALIEGIAGPGIAVLGRDRIDAEAFRMIAVEKWVTFLMLAFILLVASFNILSTLSLLIIEKRDNMTTLRALGAPLNMVTNIFAHEGWLITALGGLAGVVLGIILVLLQQHFGLIHLQGDPSALTITAYPVRLAWADVALVMATVLIVGFVIGRIPRLLKNL